MGMAGRGQRWGHDRSNDGRWGGQDTEPEDWSKPLPRNERIET